MPSANLVISYNHMKDAVELCQRQGRARQKRAAFVIMEQRVDRPLSKLLRVQRHQESVIRNFVPGHNNFQIEECRRREQRERETNILRRLLCDSRSKSDMAILNEFVQKANGHITEHILENGREFCANLIYTSQSIPTLESRSLFSANKRTAKQNAARAMLGKLEEMLRITHQEGSC